MNTLEQFKHIMLNNQEVKFLFKTVDGYRKTIVYLETENALFHTFQLKSKMHFIVVIRNLHPTCDASIVLKELQAIEYMPVKMILIHHPVTKIPVLFCFFCFLFGTKS